MEFEDLKKVWSQYDKKLTENLETNKELLRSINLDRAKTAMDKPKNYEIFSLIVVAIFLIFIINSTIQFSSEIKFLIAGILTAIWAATMLVFSIGKLKLFTDLDFYNQPILNIQKQLATIKKKYLNYKRIELFSYPLFVVVAAPILGKALRGFDLFTSPTRFAIAVGLSLVIGYPISIWVYKNWYDKKLKNAEDFLGELNKFEEEEPEA